MLSLCSVSSKIVSNAELPSMKATPIHFMGIIHVPVIPNVRILLADSVVVGRNLEMPGKQQTCTGIDAERGPVENE